MIAKLIFLLGAALVSIEAAGLTGYSSGSITPYSGQRGISALSSPVSSPHVPVIAGPAIPSYHSPAIVVSPPAYTSYHSPAVPPAISTYHAPAISPFNSPPTFPISAHPPIPPYTPEVSAFHGTPILPSFNSAPGFYGPIGHYGTSYGQESLGGRYAF